MSSLWAQITGRSSHPLIQFIKYGICGVLATLVDVAIFYVLAWKLFPALQPDDPVVQFLGMNVEAITESTRALNFVINKTLSFLCANMVAYVTNFVWVFESGRHGRRKEITLFYAVSIVSWLLGTFVGWLLIASFGMSTTAAYVANAVAAVMINFAGRKYLVFKG